MCLRIFVLASLIITFLDNSQSATIPFSRLSLMPPSRNMGSNVIADGRVKGPEVAVVTQNELDKKVLDAKNVEKEKEDEKKVVKIEKLEMVDKVDDKKDENGKEESKKEPQLEPGPPFIPLQLGEDGSPAVDLDEGAAALAEWKLNVIAKLRAESSNPDPISYVASILGIEPPNLSTSSKLKQGHAFSDTNGIFGIDFFQNLFAQGLFNLGTPFNNLGSTFSGMSQIIADAGGSHAAANILDGIAGLTDIPDLGSVANPGHAGGLFANVIPAASLVLPSSPHLG